MIPLMLAWSIGGPMIMRLGVEQIAASFALALVMIALACRLRFELPQWASTAIVGASAFAPIVVRVTMC